MNRKEIVEQIKKIEKALATKPSWLIDAQKTWEELRHLHRELRHVKRGDDQGK